MLKPRLCDERIKSPILVSLIGRGSVPLRSGIVPRTRVSPNCVSAGLGIHPILFPLWEEFSQLVRAFLGNFPGFFPFVSHFLQGNFRGFSPFVSLFSPLFPGVIPRAKGYLGSDSSFISVEGLGFRPSIPFPGSRYPFLDNYFWADPQPATHAPHTGASSLLMPLTARHSKYLIDIYKIHSSDDDDES